VATRYIGDGQRVITEVVELDRLAYNEEQAGAAVARYDVLYMDGEFVSPAQASAAATVPGMGMAFAGSALSGGRLDVMIRGTVSNGAWNFVSNALIYLSALSAGLLTNSAPPNSGDYVQRMGRSRTPDSIEFSPEDSYVQVVV